MNLDDTICHCYHVSLRKLVAYARRERPVVASGMSQCLGAGTGCGWCIPILKRIHAAAMAEAPAAPAVSNDAMANDLIAQLPAAVEDCAALRQDYIREQRPRNQFDAPAGGGA